MRHNPLIDPGELERLHDECYSWALTCVGGRRNEAEDVLQMTYLALLEGRAIFGGTASLRTWLFAVIRNQAYSRLRRVRFSLRALGQLAAATPPRLADDDALPQRAYERQQRSDLVFAAWRSLPARQREILDLVFYRDLPIAEAAHVLGISVGSARTHYERAKASLRRRLTNPGTPS